MRGGAPRRREMTTMPILPLLATMLAAWLMTQSGLLTRAQRHSGSGRPEIEYAWRHRAI